MAAITPTTSLSITFCAWWRHQMEIFSALLAICAGNSPVPGEVPTQRPVTRRFDVFFDLRQNKRLSKQWWGWWFETLSHPLWRHRNEFWSLQVVILGLVNAVHRLLDHASWQAWAEKNKCRLLCGFDSEDKEIPLLIYFVKAHSYAKWANITSWFLVGLYFFTVCS